MKPRASNRNAMILFGVALLLASPFLYALPGGNPFPKKSGGVSLQSTSPGTAQTGNINVSGEIRNGNDITTTGIIRAGQYYTAGQGDFGAITGSTVRLGDGTSSLPSFSFAAETDSGCFRNGANDMRCGTGTTNSDLVLLGDNVYLRSGGAVGSILISDTGAEIGPRLKLAGTTAVAGDFALSAGWGTTASVGTITGDDNHLQFTVTSAGTGQAANPTITYTFKNGTWTTVPFCQVKFEGASTASELNSNVLTQVPTATTLTMTYRATAPTAARTYTFTTMCLGI